MWPMKSIRKSNQCLYIEFYWVAAMFICLYTVGGCFPHIMAELNSCHRDSTWHCHHFTLWVEVTHL